MVSSSHPAIQNYPMVSSFDLFVIGGMVLCTEFLEPWFTTWPPLNTPKMYGRLITFIETCFLLP